MIRTFAVGLNHIDWMSIDYNFCIPAFPWVSTYSSFGGTSETLTAHGRSRDEKRLGWSRKSAQRSRTGRKEIEYGPVSEGLH